MEASSFDTRAKDWDKKKERLELAQNVASGLAKLPIEKSMEGLEFGCGTGLVGLAVAPLLHHLTCVDSSGAMIDNLQAKIDENPTFSNVTALHLDVLHTPLEKKYDFIFCSMVLHHIEDIDGCLSKLCDCLKSGGILAVADLDEEDGSFHSHKNPHHSHNGFNRESFRNKLEKYSLEDVHFSTVHTFHKADKDGVQRPYTVFLAHCTKTASE